MGVSVVFIRGIDSKLIRLGKEITSKDFPQHGEVLFLWSGFQYWRANAGTL
jgi:hypothetical protein